MIWAKQKAHHLLVWPVAAMLLLLFSAGCGGNDTGNGNGNNVADLEPVALAGGERLAVVATTNIVGDVVAQIGGESIELLTLMGPGVDPHSYVPTPADTAAVHDADVVFGSGLGLEASLERTLSGTGGDAVVIELSHDLALLPTAGEPEAGEQDSDHAGVDPHVWFSVPNIITWAVTIEQALSTLDPGNAALYQANADAYVQELQALDSWILDQVALIPEGNRKLVTSHAVFGYFAQRYGFEQVGAVYPVSPSAEPSARDIAQIEDMIRALDVPAVFTESTVNPQLAQQVADDTGVRLVRLFTDSLGEAGSGVESYVEMMRYDVSAMVEALR